MITSENTDSGVTSTCDAARGGFLFSRCWAPAGEPVGGVAIVHGLGEHSGRYTHVAAQLAEAGFVVFAWDLPGHGESSGPRGHVTAYAGLLDDIERMAGKLRLRAPGAPVFLYGHSLGGNLVLNFLLRRSPQIQGAVASSPFLLPTIPPPAWKRAAARLLRYLGPSVTFATGIEATELSHDPAARAAYQSDPLVHNRVSARLAVSMFAAGRWALAHASRLAVPTLILHGGADPIASSAASAEFARRAGETCRHRVWPGLLHELHWERECDGVVGCAVDWMKRVERRTSNVRPTSNVER